MTTIDGVDEVVLNLYGHFHLRGLHILADYLDATLDTLIFVGEVLKPVCSEFLQHIYVLLRQCQYCLGLEGDSVTHVTALPTG